jgi:dihydrofolate reductase
MIVAADLDDCIGNRGDLPWKLPGDLAFFRETTRGHVCVTGSRTQHSIKQRLGHPLPGRITVCVTRWASYSCGSVITVSQPEEALGVARAIEAFAGRDEVFVIGGARIYASLLPEVERIYLTRVQSHASGDAFLETGWLSGFRIESTSGLIRTSRDETTYIHQVYARKESHD